MSDYNTTMLSLEPGDSLSGRYRLERVIGEGGMAVVWLATDLNLDRLVAIKVLPTALSRDVRAITRLKAEAVRNLELTHPNIVRLHSFEQDPVRGNQAYLVMQCVEGKTLHEYLAEHPDGLPKKQVQKWSAQIAAAIDFAHKRGILHRDIKPSNIIIENATGDAYLMDFGIAREARDTMTMVTGRQQESSGTLPYMSPQQLVGKNDKSNDIYSFAATLYEALCGHPPFYTGEIAYQIREIEPEPIESLSKSANAALLAGLAKDASKRPGTCMAMLRASSSQPQVISTVAPGDTKAGENISPATTPIIEASPIEHEAKPTSHWSFVMLASSAVILVALYLVGHGLIAIWSVFIVSSIWVMLDSKAYEIAAGKKPYSVMNGSLAWGISVFLIWIIAFPMYLVRRHRVMRFRRTYSGVSGKMICPRCNDDLVVDPQLSGKRIRCTSCKKKMRVPCWNDSGPMSPNSLAITCSGVLIIAAYVVIFIGTIWIIANGNGYSDKNAIDRVQSQVEASITKTMKKQYPNFNIQSFKLVHVDGKEYRGTILVVVNGETVSRIVDVTDNGESLSWTMRE
jgi:serine/threonine protein kinase